MTAEQEKHHAQVLGSLLGCAVGDSIGLPFEGLSSRRARRINQGNAKQRLLFGKGMFSDDTEHTLMIANSLIRHKDDEKAFAKTFAWSLRWWITALPAGVGLSTARATIKLWLGFSETKSGVYSAGNGTAMRSAILGAVFSNDAEKRASFVLASSRVTHSDPRASEAATLVAEATTCACKNLETSEVIQVLQTHIQSKEMKRGFRLLIDALAQNKEVPDFSEEWGQNREINGFAPETVSIALFAWLRHRGDFRAMINAVLECGGDTDTAAAILGGIAGAECGESGIPSEWIDTISDWPRSVSYLRGTAAKLTDQSDDKRPIPLAVIAIPFRNIFFLLIVILHGFRRLLPPY